MNIDLELDYGIVSRKNLSILEAPSRTLKP